MGEITRSAPGSVSDADPGQVSGPRRALRAVLSGLDRAATVVCKILSYGAH